jgi:hypothetical protein
VILPGFYLRSRANKVWDESGIDSLAYAKDVNYFKNYPHNVSYNHNSRGFRDQEWPEDSQLQNAVWCLGDSFTVGLGCEITHSWPQVLQSTINSRTINVSMDGASNMWIARKAIELIQTVAPKNIVILWSYFHRREEANDYPDEMRRIFGTKDATDKDDLLNFVECASSVMSHANSTNVIHGIIPHAVRWTGVGKRYGGETHLKTTWNNIKGANWPRDCPDTIEQLLSLDSAIIDELKTFFKIYDDIEFNIFYLEQIKKISIKNNLGVINQLDYARDAHHFGLITSQSFVEQIVPLLQID